LNPVLKISLFGFPIMDCPDCVAKMPQKLNK
jgi:hypothetical protein